MSGRAERIQITAVSGFCLISSSVLHAQTAGCAHTAVNALGCHNFICWASTKMALFCTWCQVEDSFLN